MSKAQSALAGAIVVDFGVEAVLEEEAEVAVPEMKVDFRELSGAATVTLGGASNAICAKN